MLQTFGQWFSESGNQQLLIGILIALVLGFVIGTFLRRGNREALGKMTQKGDEAFFKGIQYMLSNDHDHAIEEFTKSVQVHSDTIETYIALGNLFRSKGDIDRAIRIRETIMLRPNVEEEIKLRSLFDLGLDYRKGGFLNRALKTFQQLAQKTPSDVETLRQIERIHEELRDWENAHMTRKKISKLTKGDDRHILAHQLVEAGKGYQKNGETNKAVSNYNKAISTHKACVDAYLQLGDLYFEKQEYKRAVSEWKKIVKVAPYFSFLAYDRLDKAYSGIKDLKPVGDFLKAYAQSSRDAFTFIALARYLYNEGDMEGALEQIDRAMEFDTNFWETRKLRGEILLAQARTKDALHDYEDLIRNLNLPYLRFQCAQCGFQPNGLEWQCPQCKCWDTIRLIESKGQQPTSGNQTQELLPKIL